MCYGVAQRKEVLMANDYHLGLGLLAALAAYLPLGILVEMLKTKQLTRILFAGLAVYVLWRFYTIMPQWQR